MATLAERRVQSRDVVNASGVVEHMEQTAVDDGVEGLAQRVEVERIVHLKTGIGTTLDRLATGVLDGARGNVDTEGTGAVKRGEDRVLTGAAAGA